MGDHEPRDRKRSAATAGPSADDRFGPGPIGTNMQSRILAVAVEGDRTISMCKALLSLGLVAAVQDTSVNLWIRGTDRASITGRHRGDWYENDWMNTPEFAAFWRVTLGAPAFVGSANDKEPRQIGNASQDDVTRSRSTEMVGFASSRKRE